MDSVRRVAENSWMTELDSFSRQHEGWLVSIKTRTPDGKVAVAARDVPLRGVTAMAPEAHDIAVMVGDADNHLTHDVRGAIAVRIELTPDRAERALLIDTKDGSTISIEFRSPMRAEQVDGLAAPDRAS